MSGIQVIVEGDREIAAKFDTFPEHLRDNLRARIAGLTDELADRVRGLVPKKTGKLAGSIAADVSDGPGYVSGRVFLTGDYAVAGALEYGVHASETVRAHEMRLGHVFARAVSPPLLVDDPAHDRRVNISARRFLRGPLEAMRGEIDASLQTAIDAAADE